MEKLIFKKELIKDENLISWNNKTSLYLDKTTLPYTCKSILDLNNKCVLYYIITNKEITYIGITTDFGQRVQTHNKESRNDKDDNKKKLYKDIELYGSAIVGILGVYETYEEGRNAESNLIKEIKETYLTEQYGFDYSFLISENEQKEFLFTKFYNIQN